MKIPRHLCMEIALESGVNAGVADTPAQWSSEQVVRLDHHRSLR
jgi:hypothetical protein